MNRKDIVTLAVVGSITAVISFSLSSIFFNPPEHDRKVPSVDSLPASLPDMKNDASYNSFLNDKALDPTQSVQIAPEDNKVPFNSRQ